MEIPGYYFDKEKKRYFKVESSRTAPETSAWSSDNVKRRKVENKKTDVATRTLMANKDRIKLSRARNEPLMGGFLAREFGSLSLDVPLSAFAMGLLEKGSLPLADARWRSTGNLKNLCVTSKDTRTGLGVAFATLDDFALISTYIPRDSNGRIHRQLLNAYNLPGSHFAPYQELVVSQISDVKYHSPTNKILVSSRRTGMGISIWDFSPWDISDEEATHAPRTPRWLLGRSGLGHGSVFTNQEVPGPVRPDGLVVNDYQSNVLLPGPESDSSTIAIVGSTQGILRWPAQEHPQWLAPTTDQGRFVSSPKPFSDIFALDFQGGDPNILLSGGRPGKVFVGDVRESFRDWNYLHHGSSISHIKSLDQHHVLVAGLNSTMVIYDTRMLKIRSQSQPSSRKLVTPVLKFHEYQNRAHIDIGLALNKEMGMVAAAHDDGGVALYSVKTGHRLSSPDIDAIESSQGPIQSIQFQTMPNDVNPTLFVGVRSNLNAYSFGVRDLMDEA